jgi:hypothetical protein
MAERKKCWLENDHKNGEQETHDGRREGKGIGETFPRTQSHLRCANSPRYTRFHYTELIAPTGSRATGGYPRFSPDHCDWTTPS